MNEELPITGLCIVAQQCPAGYLMIDKCEDNARTEADLWKDHIFAKKVKRFLCVTRVFPLDGGRLNNVLIDICVNEERDPVPAGYSLISTTQDTAEPAFKKKQMSVRLVSRTEATDAITDIQFLCKSRRAPNGYTLAGEMNGLMVCYRVGKVPQSTAPIVPPSYSSLATHGNTTYTGIVGPAPIVAQQYNPYTSSPPVMVGTQGHGDGSMYNHTNPGTVNVTPQRQNSRVHPLTDVPFEINPKLVPDTNQSVVIPTTRFRTRENIMHEFDYPFTVEQQAQHTSQSYNGLQ